MNIGLTRGKPAPVESPDYKELDRRIRALQAQSSALYENDTIEDDELDALVAPIDAEIAELVDRLYLPTKSRAGGKSGERMEKMEKKFEKFGEACEAADDVAKHLHDGGKFTVVDVVPGEKSNNGGEYGFYTVYYPTICRGVYTEVTSTTCDFDDLGTGFNGYVVLTHKDYKKLILASCRVEANGSQY